VPRKRQGIELAGGMVDVGAGGVVITGVGATVGWGVGWGVATAVGCGDGVGVADSPSQATATRATASIIRGTNMAVNFVISSPFAYYTTNDYVFAGTLTGGAASRCFYT
jgi:hypothetical protein